jgi:hypothetical protein
VILLDGSNSSEINSLMSRSSEFFKNCAPEGLFMCIELFVSQIKSFLITDDYFGSWDKLFNLGRELVMY